jgi:pSer/pThr/pTyr-binding forkhead associated (FHA) protein
MDDFQAVPFDSQRQNNESSDSGPTDAFLVEGIKVIPLPWTVTNIGRRVENEVVIEDPRVSRYHAQLRLIDNRYILFDLNSTGGTYVNGRRIEQSVIYSGDTISLAGVELIFKVSNELPRPDLKGTARF